MSYSPNNVAIYLNAFAGSMAGLAAADKYVTDPTEADYSVYATAADALAQEIDTVWGTATFTSADLLQLQAATSAVWGAGRSPLPTAQASTPGSYSNLAAALVAAVQAGTAQIVAEGINPGAGGASGSLHTFNSVNASDTGTGNTTTYDTGLVVPKTTGFISVWGYMSVTGVASAVDGDVINFQLRKGGAVDSTSIIQSQQFGPTAFKASASLHNIYACVAGVAQTFGIQATDVTTGGATIKSSAGQTCIYAQENQVGTG
jgi:hypothetical protein